MVGVLTDSVPAVVVDVVVTDGDVVGVVMGIEPVADVVMHLVLCTLLGEIPNNTRKRTRTHTQRGNSKCHEYSDGSVVLKSLFLVSQVEHHRKNKGGAHGRHDK